MTEAFKAVGLHSAMYAIPVLAVLASLVLFAARATDGSGHPQAATARIAAEPPRHASAGIAEARQVKVGIAEAQIDHRQPLEVVADDEIIDHAHGAVHLHRLLTDQARRLANVGLGARHGAAALGGISESRVHAAMTAIERACSAAMNISAMRCCSAWNLPMGTPNCLRSSSRSSVASFSATMMPTASAQSAATPRSTARSTMGRARPAEPISASAPTARSRGAGRRHGRPIAWDRRYSVSPAPHGRPRTGKCRGGIATSPLKRADTRKPSADGASSTTVLLPDRRQPAPLDAHARSHATCDKVIASRPPRNRRAPA
jgi:hypothetical protein